MELNVILGLPVLLTAIFSIFCAVLKFNYRRNSDSKSYQKKDWNFYLKKWWALRSIREWKKTRQDDVSYQWETELPGKLHNDSSDNITFYGTNNKNQSLYISFTKRLSKISDVILILTLEDGTVYQLPNGGNANCVSHSPESWKVGDLTLTVLEEFRKWRIVFNGLLNSTNKNGENSLKHIRFNFIWIYATSPSNIPRDCSDSLLAEAVALKPWKDPYWLSDVTEIKMKGYDQYGCFMGFAIVDEDLGQQAITLHGLRTRRWRPDKFSLRKYVSLLGTASDGTVYIVEMEISRQRTLIKYGNIRLPDGRVESLDGVDFNTEFLDRDSSDIPKAFTIKLSTKSRNFVIFVTLNKKETLEYVGSHPEAWKSQMIPYQMGVNGYQGSGILQMWQPTGGATFLKSDLFTKHLVWLPLESVSEKVPFCATFKEQVATCPAVVGGKAASLALLSSVDSDKYTVPNGFCLTSRALETQLEHNNQLTEAINEIEKAVVNYSEANMKKCCQRATSLIESTPICDIVKELISCHFEELCEKESNKNNDKMCFAVRSSGIGEDSEELSAAGQNITILGCKSLLEILDAVQKCWASLFTFQSVEYRRQFSQVLNCGMGVVVQTVIESEKAGVMFTRHPNNGDPTQILITSSFGLGESVVSGHVEPDSIIVEVNGDALRVKSYDIGKKGQQINIDHSGNQQTLSTALNEEESKKRSLSDEECLALAALGTQQEGLWGSPRDIEWAIVKGNMYLLQARPITSLSNWTEYELLHDQDTAIMSDDDFMTFANTGEVMPGAISPLAQTLIVDVVDKMICMDVGLPTDHVIRPPASMTNTQHHMGLNVFNSLLKNPEKSISIRIKTLDIAVAGHTITNEKNLSVAIHRNGYNRSAALKVTILYLKSILNSEKRTKACVEACDKFQIDFSKCKTAVEMYEEIIKSVKHFEYTAQAHLAITRASVFSQIIILSIIIGSSTDFTTENYQDIATILSSCSDAVSAEIPEHLKKIAIALKESGKMEDFKQQNTADALNWLKDNIPNVHSMLTSFLKRHGHRCMFEFDVFRDAWGMDPTPLIKTLQMSQDVTMKDSNKAGSTNELIAKLVTPMTKNTRRALKFIIPMCQKLVSRREATKDANVSLVHKLRMAFRQLEEQMIKEWRIPDKKLIYMLTHFELGRLLKTRDPGLVAKAKLRMRYFPKWNKIRFPENNWGVPQPIVMEDTLRHLQNGSGDITLKGTPVCSGDVVARACVIQDISQIGDLQNGDILVTHSTDIGWSPYFPMLSGVVTELGGLISHGAVVAREYGLPCIVGVEGATSVFKTGDNIFLSAGKGFMKKSDSS